MGFRVVLGGLDFVRVVGVVGGGVVFGSGLGLVWVLGEVIEFMGFSCLFYVGFR